MAYANAFRTPLHGSTRPAAIAASSFPVDPDLLNPRFEAYRLVAEDASDATSLPCIQQLHPLPSRPLGLRQSYDLGIASEGKALGFKEAKERALHPFLVPACLDASDPSSAADAPVAGYIDRNGFVVLLSFQRSSDGQHQPKVVGHPVHRLDLESAPATGYSRSLPSLFSLSPTRWLAADGSGGVVVLELEGLEQLGGQKRWISKIVGRWRLDADVADSVPFSIAAAEADTQGKVHVLVQTCRKEAQSRAASAGSMGDLGFSARGGAARSGPSGSITTVFDVRLLLLDLVRARSSEWERQAPTCAASIQWTVTGQEPLFYARLDLRSGRHMLGSESGYHVKRKQQQPSTLEASSSIAGTGRTHERGERSSGSVGGEPSSEQSQGDVAFRPRRPPHYSWAQTSDTLTVAFSLPADVAKSDIRIHFAPRGISLSLADLAAAKQPRIVELGTEADAPANDAHERDSQDPLCHAAKLVQSGRYVSRALWGEIDPTGSVWTWERAVGNAGALKGRPMGILTLHLEKKHEGTRWMQVFADRRDPSLASKQQATQLSSWERVSQKTKLTFREARERAARVASGETADVGDEDEKEEQEGRGREAREEDDDEDEEDDEDDVPETLDPSELITMLEGMEKYTADDEASAIGGEGPGPALGSDRTGFTDQSNLLRDGLEEEDENVGRPLVISWISGGGVDDGHDVAEVRVERPAKDDSEERSLLALPLPTTGAAGEAGCIAVKHDLDGAVFAPPAPSVDRSAAMSWKHADTLSALAFVLASKRDAHRVLVYHRSGEAERRAAGYASAVLAFEAAPQVGLNAATSDKTDPVGGAGNLFVYYSPPASDAADARKHGRSRVIRLGGGYEHQGTGALLGVAAVADVERGGAAKIVMCLCERSVLLLRNVL